MSKKGLVVGDIGLPGGNECGCGGGVAGRPIAATTDFLGVAGSPVGRATPLDGSTGVGGQNVGDCKLSDGGPGLEGGDDGVVCEGVDVGCRTAV